MPLIQSSRPELAPYNGQFCNVIRGIGPDDKGFDRSKPQAIVRLASGREFTLFAHEFEGVVNDIAHRVEETYQNGLRADQERLRRVTRDRLTAEDQVRAEMRQVAGADRVDKGASAAA